jgi:type IV pilus assembly protein PilM
MLDPGLVSEGVILDENRVAVAVKDLFKRQGITETNVTVGISGLNSVFRIISIPEVPKKLLEEAVGNEASRILPMALSQVYYSYQALPSPKGEMRLFLVAYPRESTDSLLSVIQKAGLKAGLMDLGPLALARCVNAERAILVNSWLTFVDIIVLSERIPVVIRSLSLPVEGTSLRERMPAVTEELNRTITFYNSTYSEKPLDKTIQIFVSGDIAGDNESVQYLGKLGYPVSVLEPPLAYKDVFNPTQYMVNAGLALKGRSTTGSGNQCSTIDFNALPKAYQPIPFSVSRVLIPVGAVVAVGALFYGAAALNSLRNDTKSINASYNLIQVQTAKLRTDNQATSDSVAATGAQSTALAAQAKALQGQIDDIDQNSSFFTSQMGNLKSGLSDCDLDVREIINDSPKGLNITSMDYLTDGITIKGIASNQALVLTYARSLRTSGRFLTVTVTNIDSMDDGTAEFAISMH